ncbi:MAG: hypothetical protein ACYC6G_13290 [Desulfobaccales bacterium]
MSRKGRAQRAYQAGMVRNQDADKLTPATGPRFTDLENYAEKRQIEEII